MEPGLVYSIGHVVLFLSWRKILSGRIGVLGFVGIVCCSSLVLALYAIWKSPLELFGGAIGGWEPLSTGRGAGDLDIKST